MQKRLRRLGHPLAVSSRPSPERPDLRKTMSEPQTRPPASSGENLAGENSAGESLSGESLRLRSRGVFTLPKRLREKYDLGEGDALRLVDLGGVFALTPLRPMVPELSREIERLREEAGLSTDELLESLRSERRRSYQERYAGDLARFAEEAFEVYSGEDRQWRWRLSDTDGSETDGSETDGEVLAASSESYPRRAGAEEALATFKAWAAAANVVGVASEPGTDRSGSESARLEIYQGEPEGAFGWRLLAPEGQAVAESRTRHSSAEEARRAGQRAGRIAALGMKSPEAEPN